MDRANKNHSRAGTHCIWQAIQEAYATVYCEPTGELSPIDRAAVNPIQLVKQGRGCLKNVLLQKGQEPQDNNDFTMQAAELIRDVGGTEEEQEDFMRHYHDLATEYRISAKGRAA